MRSLASALFAASFSWHSHAHFTVQLSCIVGVSSPPHQCKLSCTVDTGKKSGPLGENRRRDGWRLRLLNDHYCSVLVVFPQQGPSYQAPNSGGYGHVSLLPPAYYDYRVIPIGRRSMKAPGRVHSGYCITHTLVDFKVSHHHSLFSSSQNSGQLWLSVSSTLHIPPPKEKLANFSHTQRSERRDHSSINGLTQAIYRTIGYRNCRDTGYLSIERTFGGFCDRKGP